MISQVTSSPCCTAVASSAIPYIASTVAGHRERRPTGRGGGPSAAGSP